MSISKIVSKHTPLFHLGYFVEDAKAFAQQFHDLYGAGPFLVMENVPAKQTYRGVEMTTILTIATGWWKNMAVEIIQQNSEGKSYLNENGRYGFHHITIGVSDVQAACKEFEEAGCSVEMYNFSNPEFPFAYIDARDQAGYYIELNPHPDPISQIVKKWGENWDGETKLFRTLEDARKG
jgi:hypothetical protein